MVSNRRLCSCFFSVSPSLFRFLPPFLVVTTRTHTDTPDETHVHIASAARLTVQCPYYLLLFYCSYSTSSLLLSRANFFSIPFRIRQCLFHSPRLSLSLSRSRSNVFFLCVCCPRTGILGEWSVD